MSKNSLIIILGALVVLSTFLGVPSAWKTVLFWALGLGIIVTAAILRKDIASGAICLHLSEDQKTDSYSQNGMIIEQAQHYERTDENTETPRGV